MAIPTRKLPPLRLKSDTEPAPPAAVFTEKFCEHRRLEQPRPDHLAIQHRHRRHDRTGNRKLSMGIRIYRQVLDCGDPDAI